MIRFYVTLKDQVEEDGFTVQVSKSDLMCNTRNAYAGGTSRVLAIQETVEDYITNWGIEAND